MMQGTSKRDMNLTRERRTRRFINCQWTSSRASSSNLNYIANNFSVSVFEMAAYQDVTEVKVYMHFLFVPAGEHV